MNLKPWELRKREWTVLAFAAALLLLIAALAVTRLMLKPEKGEPSEEPSLTEEADQYLSETLFIGDSRTHGLSFYGFLPEGQVFAKDSMTHVQARTEGFLHLSGDIPETIAEAVAIRKPKRIIEAFGVNGLLLDEDVYWQEYEGFLDDLISASPESVLILESILPVSQEFEDSGIGITNELINRYNERLQELAFEKNAKYLDTASALKDENGCLDEQYDAGDGLHLNTKAYQILLDTVLDKRL